MSLLQEALRRAQKGEGGKAPPAAGPLPGRGRAGLAAHRRMWTGVGLVSVFLVGAGAAVLLARFPREAAVKPPLPAPSAPAPSAPTPTAAAVPGTSPRETHRASARLLPAAPRRAVGSAATPRGRAVRSGTAESGQADAGRKAHLARFNEGIAAQDRGDWEAASRRFQEVVSGDPSIVEGWNGLGNALLRLGRLPEADRAFRKALSLDPNYPAALTNAGLLRLKDGRPAEAAAFFARAATLDPRNPAPRVNLAISHARRGAVADAEETLLAARRAFPSNPDVLYHLGTVHERTGNVEKAKEAYMSFLAVTNGRQPEAERLVRERLREWTQKP